MKTYTTTSSTTTTNRTRHDHQYQPPTIPQHAPPDLPPFGELILQKLLARFDVLHAEALSLNFKNYREYVTLRGQLEFIHQQFERAAGGGAAAGGEL